MNVLIIDNYDSYTFNLYQMIGVIINKEPIVVKNDELDYWQIEKKFDFGRVVISPGPGHPKTKKNIGICQDFMEKCTKPILGICLGHQYIAYYFGSTIDKSPEMQHGLISPIYHNGDPLFKNVPNPFRAVRYHSLAIKTLGFANDLSVTARSNSGIIMGLKHKTLPIWGLQFHPESVCSEYGDVLLRNFIEQPC